MWHLISAAEAADAMARPRPSADSNALLCMMTLLGKKPDLLYVLCQRGAESRGNPPAQIDAGTRVGFVKARNPCIFRPVSFVVWQRGNRRTPVRDSPDERTFSAPVDRGKPAMQLN